jgi:hypothetical protein
MSIDVTDYARGYTHSILDLSKVHWAIKWCLLCDVERCLHLHELKEPDDHGDADEEHDEDAAQHVGVEVVPDALIVGKLGG